MKRKKTTYIVLLLMLCLTVSGCRTRTGISRQTGPDDPGGRAESLSAPVSVSLSGEETDSEPEKQEKNDDSGEQTKENPEASRKEYDEQAPAEILPGTERTAEDRGEGEGSPLENPESETSAVLLKETAEEAATQTVPAEEAEETGVSEDGKEADSALMYYTVLLRERTESLFECQRLNVYWETADDHVTIHKSSPEHSIILNAGAYDVSARLLEENLRVDDGWIGRKNPDAVVKMADSGVLGTGIQFTAAARRICDAMASRNGWRSMEAVRNGRILVLSGELMQTEYLRVFAALAVAKSAYPDLMADVDLDQALEMLVQEATGSGSNGIFYYMGGT